MRNKAFVISCKESLYIDQCVKNILNNYKDADIYIIDSCSTDKSYYNLYASSKQVQVLDCCNKNYEYGAYMYWYKLYGKLYNTYIFMQDSIMINRSIAEIENIKNDDVLVFSDNYSGWLHGMIHKKYWYDKHKDFPDINLESVLMTIWNTFIINKYTFEKIIHSDIFKQASPPDNKILSCAWERVWSIIFKENNIKIKNIQKNQITKIFGNRQ